MTPVLVCPTRGKGLNLLSWSACEDALFRKSPTPVADRGTASRPVDPHERRQHRMDIFTRTVARVWPRVDDLGGHAATAACDPGVGGPPRPRPRTLPTSERELLCLVGDELTVRHGRSCRQQAGTQGRKGHPYKRPRRR